MDLEIIKLKELSWERERQIYDIVYMWNLKKKKKLMNHKTEIEPQTYKLMVTIGEMVGEG